MSTTIPAVGPLPEEVVDYYNTATHVQKTTNKCRTILAVCVGLAMLAQGIFTVHEVSLIRDSQIANSAKAACELKAINGLLQDVPLAFSGDHNAKDYAKIAKSC